MPSDFERPQSSTNLTGRCPISWCGARFEYTARDAHSVRTVTCQKGHELQIARDNDIAVRLATHIDGTIADLRTVIELVNRYVGRR
jgi:hypothetical protein